MIILLLLLALLGGAEDSPNVPLGVVTSDGDPVPPINGLPGPSPSGGGPFRLEGHYCDIRVTDLRGCRVCGYEGLEGERVRPCGQSCMEVGAAVRHFVVCVARLPSTVPRSVRSC